MTISGGTNCTGVPVFYLTAGNTAYLLGENAGVNIGQVEPQTGRVVHYCLSLGHFLYGHA